MSTPIRTRLSFSFLTVLLIGMGLAAGLAWFTVEKLYQDTQRENLLAQARLSAASLQGEDLSTLISKPYVQTVNASPGIHTHVLEGQDAVVLSAPLMPSSPAQALPQAENGSLISAAALLQRSEIALALQGTPATAVRQVASAGHRRVLYAAAPIYSTQGGIDGLVYLAMPLPPAGLPAPVILRLVGVVLLALLLAWIAAVLFSRRISRPIETITLAADRVAAGDLHQQVASDRSIRELDSLGCSFNTMTASLRQADQAKTAFIADITHELRTPLTVIKGTLETLEDGALEDVEGRGPLLASMQQETERLIRLVNDLLVLTRADAGMLKLILHPVDLAELARSRCESFASMAQKQGVSLQVDSCEPGRVIGDPDRLVQILENLLDNAILHSPAGSTVILRLQAEAETLRCSVQDHGCGITPVHLPFIFERFYRAEASRDRHSGGSGLGLSIVRALVQAQGGRVAAESVEGQGTTVTFWLPLAPELP